MTTDTTDPRALGEELESKMRARQACRTEAAADTMTHEIGLLVCGHPEMILDALRHRFASPQTAGEVDLRGALIEAGRAAGAGLSDEVSNDFLLHVPGEVKARVASLTAERDAALVRCEEMRGAGEALRKEAALLLQNSEGCAANHYGNDHELFGMPAWLADSRARIEEASAILARAALGSGGGG